MESSAYGRALVALGLVIAIGAPGRAAAWVPLVEWDGTPIRWEITDIPWQLHPAGSDDLSFELVRDALAEAFQSIEDVSCSTIRFHYAGTATEPEDGHILVRFLEADVPVSYLAIAGWAHPQTDGAGTADGATVTFNGVVPTWVTEEPGPTETVVQRIAVHEILHGLGIDHSLDPAATLFFSFDHAGEEWVRADDVQALCATYPAGPVPLGDACDFCTADDQCADGPCLIPDDATSGWCGAACEGIEDCPAPLVCADLGLAGGQCTSPYGSCRGYEADASLGELCWDHHGCSTERCLRPGAAFDGLVEPYCTELCDPGPQACPDGMACLGHECHRPGPLATGEPCTAYGACEGLLCFGAPQGQCSQPCLPLEPGSCPAGTSCLGVGGCLGPGPGELGAACEWAVDCGGLICLGADAADARCSQACFGEDCPGEARCVRGHCLLPGEGAALSPCQWDGDCASLACATVGGELRCLDPCVPGSAASCPAGDQCLSTGVCHPPGPGSLGAPCASWADCESLWCMGGETDAACSVPCSPDAPCPSGFACLWGGCHAPGELPFGAACTGTLACQGLVCVDAVCTQSCAMADPAGCPAGTACLAGLCRSPGPGMTGAPCAWDGDCDSLVCAWNGAGSPKTCAVPCDGDGVCPDGLGCVFALCRPPGLEPLGATCEWGPDCESLACSGGSDPTCTTGCDPTTPGGCPDGLLCDTDGQCREPGLSPPGSPCGWNPDCQSLACWWNAQTSTGLCTTGCAPGGPACPEGTGCLHGYCLVPGAAGPAKPCQYDEHCASQVCVQADSAGSSSYCSAPCSPLQASCPEPMVCSASGRCRLPGVVATGQPCQWSEDCASHWCVETGLEGEQVCATPCDGGEGLGEPCPAGLICVYGICLPPGSLVDGQPCGWSGQCQGLVCTGSPPRCASPCGPAVDLCGLGFTCSGGLCVLPGPLTFGAECASDFDCQSLLCDRPGPEVPGACAVACDPLGAGDCPPGAACLANGRCYTPGPGAPGDPCVGQPDCANLVCRHDTGEGVCSIPCDLFDPAPCPAGQVCGHGALCEEPAWTFSELAGAPDPDDADAAEVSAPDAPAVAEPPPTSLVETEPEAETEAEAEADGDAGDVPGGPSQASRGSGGCQLIEGRPPPTRRPSAVVLVLLLLLVARACAVCGPARLARRGRART